MRIYAMMREREFGSPMLEKYCTGTVGGAVTTAARSFVQVMSHLPLPFRSLHFVRPKSRAADHRLRRPTDDALDQDIARKSSVPLPGACHRYFVIIVQRLEMM